MATTGIKESTEGEEAPGAWVWGGEGYAQIYLTATMPKLQGEKTVRLNTQRCNLVPFCISNVESEGGARTCKLSMTYVCFRCYITAQEPGYAW